MIRTTSSVIDWTHMRRVEIVFVRVGVRQWHPPAEVRVVARLVSVRQVARLWELRRVRVVVSVDLDYWITDLKRPCVHDVLNCELLRQHLTAVSDLSECSPKVVLLSVGVFVFLEVVRDAVLEALLTQKLVHHSNDHRTFGVADCIENLRDLVRMTDFDWNWMTRLEGVELENVQSVANAFFFERVPFRMKMSDTQWSDVSCKAFDVNSTNQLSLRW